MISEVISEALKLVKPSREEEEALMKAANEVIKVYDEGLREMGVEAEVTLQGSVAHGTWLPGDRDIDVFVVLPKSEENLKLITSGKFAEALAKIAESRGIPWAMRYAQHPYITLSYRGFQVDVVPCLRIMPGERPLTAADRTPLHTMYLKDRLSGLRDDVRLLKLFMKGIGVYGAEISVQGFSGYLAELLTIAYGGFLNTIKAASTWIPYRVRIVIEGRGAKVPRSPLIVIDPVDPHRNAAASVSLESMATMIAASRQFLKKPSLIFFKRGEASYEPRYTPPVAVVYGEYPRNLAEDIVWGLLRRILDSVNRALPKLGFKIYRVGAYASQVHVALMVMVEEHTLTEYELHEGPPVWSSASEEFLNKYASSDNVTGPFIRDGRWFVIRPRRVVNVVDAIKALLKTLKQDPVRDALLNGSYVVVDGLGSLGNMPGDVAAGVRPFILSKPHWLTGS